MLKKIGKYCFLFMCAYVFINAQTFLGVTNLTHVTLDDVRINGSAVLHDVDFKSLLVNGTANITDFKIDIAKINGSFNVRNGKISGDLEVHGNFIGHKIVVHGNSSIKGNIKLHNSEVQFLEVNTRNCILNNVTTKNIKFLQEEGGKKQKLFLQGKTIVNGSITFQSANGIVYASRAAIIKGKIIGGRVIISK